MPSDKRARQRAAREERLAAEARAKKRRKQIRNTVIVVVIAGVILLIVFLTSSNSPKKSNSSSSTTTTVAGHSKDATLQAAANKVAVAAGCPASTSARVNTQQYSAAPPMTINTAATYTATIKTTTGTFTIALDAKAAPVTVNSFVFLAGKGYFHCNIFHRVIPGFVDQSGDPTGTGTGGPGYEFADENIPKAYATGDVAMANSGGTDTNGSQFFIVAPGGASALDSDLSSGGYSLFGQVTSGQNVVNTINNEGSSSGTPKVVQRMLSVTIHTS